MLCLDDIRRIYMREGPVARAAIAAFFVAAVIYGGGKGDGGGQMRGDDPQEQTRSGGAPQALPQWYLDCGYVATDTDGDGIPDCWERWTGTDPLVFDSAGDLDDDGLSNLDEFAHQTDPQCADTDNDGFGDAEEIAAASAGLSAADPVSPAQFAVEEPDTDGDGIPDAWEDEGAPLFTGVGGDGFPAGIAVPEALPWNYDVLLTITTSRHALLSWGSAAAEKVLLPPCDDQTVRLRLDATDTRTVTLSALPAGTASCAWRGGLSAEWDSRREHPTEGNRIETAFSTFVDKEGEEGVRSEFLGLPGAGLRSGNGGGGIRSLSFLSKPWSMSLLVDSGCAAHDPFVRVELVEDNVPPPYVWTYVGCETNETTNTVLHLSADVFAFDNSFEVGVRQSDGIHSNLCPGAATRISIGHCMGNSTNFMPAMSGSSHDPTDASDHLPQLYHEPISGIGFNCPPATNLIVKAGWTHDTQILHIRNLVRIQTCDPRDDETDHCIGLVWSAGGSINLYDYLADESKPFEEFFDYYVNDVENDGTLEFGPIPEEFHPSVFHVELRLADSGAVLDRMWVVVNARKTDYNFGKWYSQNADTSWVNTLPKPYSKLQITANAWGYGATPVNPLNPDPWSSPSLLYGYLHHDSEWEMRSHKVTYHGNQACYDSNGNIVLSGIAGGTADLYYAGDLTVDKHISEDVDPYLNALHLDGNPGDTGWLNGISRPCLYQGDSLDKYIERRPIIQPQGEQ